MSDAGTTGSMAERTTAELSAIYRTEFDPLKLHRIFGCKQYRNQHHITAASSNASLLSTGSRPATIGDYTTLPRPPKGKPIRKRRKFLDKCHMDIVYGSEGA